MQYIGFDSHKKYTLASVEAESGGIVKEERIEHERGAIRKFLEGCERGSPVAVETIGNWYWIVDEIEEAGMVPRLVNARKAKLMMGSINKTDKLDVRGLNMLQRNKTLPTVWIPPADLRDKRDLPRSRMVLVRQRTQLKNRIHSTMAKYALTIHEVSDAFGVRGREILGERVEQLAPETRFATGQLSEGLDVLEELIEEFEARIKKVFQQTPEVRLLMTMPGIGYILGVTIALEVGAIERFASAERLAAYAGTTPRVHSSGGKTRFGPTRSDVNRYLKWAFIEAANTACVWRAKRPDSHISRLYNRIAFRRGHAKAIGAVARHLSEATYWILKKREPYFEPKTSKVSSTGR